MDGPPVYSVDDLDDDVDVDLEDDDVDDDEDTSSSNLAAGIDNTTPDPRSSDGIVTVASAADHSHVLAIPAAAATEKKPVATAGLFQRLWTDEDEIELLRGFLEYTSQRGGVHHSYQHHDTAAFYDQIKSKLQLDFNKNQLVEKLRRLKKKYRTIAGKMNSGKDYVFKSAHEQATFEISKKIWYEPVTLVVDPGLEENGLNPNHYINPSFISFHQSDNGVDLNLKGTTKSRKRVKLVKSEEVPQFSPQIPQVATPVGSSVSGLIEETVKSCLTPILKELVHSSTSSSRGFGVMSPMGFNLGNLGNLSPLDFVNGGEMNSVMDDKWRKQQILELEVYSQRLALVQEQIKSTVEELRAKGN